MKLTKLGKHEAYLRLYGILKSLPIAKAKKDIQLELERELASELLSNWRKSYTKALKEIFEKIPSGISDKVIKIIEAGLSKALGHNFGNSKGTKKLIHDYLKSAYVKAKKDFSVNSSFNLIDKRAVNVLAKHNCFWVGEHYGKHIGPKISAITQKAIDEGLGRKELAEELRYALGGEVGDYKYWDVVSSAALVRARSFGSIAGMEEAGITEYEILAMGDERMCEICEEMNGKTFSVEETRKVINKVIDIEDPEKFKEAMPWQTVSSKGKSNQELLDAGMSIPPFHGRCRCVLVMSE